MLETRPGVYFWQGSHPEWVPDQGWDEAVTAYALDDGEQLVVIDPIAPPAELDQLAASRRTTIVLTCPWHRRDAQPLAQRLGAPIYVPPPDPDDASPVAGTVYVGGERLPVGLEAFPGLEPSDLVLWSEQHGAVIAGDTLVERAEGLVIPLDWAKPGFDPEALRQALAPLLERRVDVVLPTHGSPTDRDALERALAQP